VYGITDKDRRYLQILKNSVGYVKGGLSKTHNLKIGILGQMFCHLVNNLMEGPDNFIFSADLHCKRRQEVYQILSHYYQTTWQHFAEKNKCCHRHQKLKY